MRYTRSDLNALCEKLNKRLADSGLTMRYEIQSRNGYTAADLYAGDGCLRAIGTGSPKDCAFAVMEHALTLFTRIGEDYTAQ